MIDLIQFSAFHFLRPWWLLVLPLVVSAVFYLRHRRESDVRWRGIIAPHLLQALTIRGGSHHWFNPANMGMLLLALSVVLMAGPSWQRQPSPFVQDKAVLVIALDLSVTMQQGDIQPSRLQRAKQKIADLLELRGDARTGLIAYAGSAHQVIPLSNDPEIIHQFLAAVDVNMMPKAGKFPETVIPLADRMLRDAAVPGTLLVIGDGVSPSTQQSFERYFEKTRYQLLVLGTGLTEMPETASDEQQFGGAYLALQEDALQSLASAAGGYYQGITADKADIQRLNRLVDYHLAVVADGDRPWVDAGYFLLYPIALMFLFWFRRGWTLNWCIALFCLQLLSSSPPVMAADVSVAGTEIEQPALESAAQVQFFKRIRQGFWDLWLSPDQQGRYYFERGDYARAAQAFQNPAWQGMAFYYAENFSAAAELFRRLDSSTGRFNLANALAQGQHYVLAVRTYDEVLKEVPDHAGALKNRALVQEIIDDINRMSASQQAEAGEVTRELGDAPLRAEGARQRDIASPQEQQQLSADQLLADEEIHAMWMRQVQPDPARFLSAKFHLQYNRQSAGAGQQLPSSGEADE